MLDRGSPGLEIEVKVLDIDPERIERVLRELGATKKWSGRMETAIYDTPDRQLRGKGAYVRLRAQPGAGTILGYKGRTPGSPGYKVVEEIEFAVSDPGAASQFLGKMGLVRVSFLQKDRILYELGEIQFCLDRWPHLPTYLEVEAPTTALVDRGLELLGIPHGQATNMGPADLFRHYGFDLDAMPQVLFETSP